MKRIYSLLAPIVILVGHNALAVQAPRCLNDETYPGVIKTWGEFVIKVEPALKGPKDVTEVTAVLNEADSESSGLDWSYTYDGKGNAYVAAKFKAWGYDGTHDTDDGFHKRRNAEVAKAYAALDKVASMPGVTIKCDVFSELDAPRRGALIRLSWVKPSSLKHSVGESSADLIRLFWSKNFKNPLAPKEIWYDVRNVVCKTPFGSGQKEAWTCFVNEYGALFFVFNGDDAASLARLLFAARAQVDDAGGVRTLKAEDLRCTAKNLQADPLGFTDDKCEFAAR